MRQLLVVVALAGCGHHDSDKRDSGAADDGSMQTSDGNPGDGNGNTGSTSIDGQTVSCYSQAAPATTCTVPAHCCFSNFSAQHDGSCQATACTWGTIECDGPEDCTNNGHCCSTHLSDSNGFIGYRLRCQAAACGAQQEELCHTGGAACGTGSCVTAFGNNNDLPRSLFICR
ncbi:MAG TPA: hypothetical protein VMZ53_06775 [Kofleriaceae bacterium]|nr:hypothetical protein [Kofleriaceae bacterium]